MNILYIADVRMPTEKAHGLQIMKTCEAFADLGHRVTLLAPRRRNNIATDPFEYYNVRNNFEIQRVYSLDLIHWGMAGFWIQYVTFSLCAAFSKHVRGVDIIYGRDQVSLWFVSFFTQTPIVWESHVGAWSGAARAVARRARMIVTISNGGKDFYVTQGVPAKKIVVAPDGVDLKDFEHAESKTDARRRLGLPLDKKLALYIGRLDEWKGVVTLCDAAQYLTQDTQVVIMGGEPAQVEDLKRRYPAVTFLGFHPYRELAGNQSAADVLVLPNSSKTEISARFTSPLKLFTYMASERPIVASDLPSIREVLDESMAYVVTPDDPRALAAGIQTVFEDSYAPMRTSAARRAVEKYTWSKRAEQILSAYKTV